MRTTLAPAWLVHLALLAAAALLPALPARAMVIETYAHVLLISPTVSPFLICERSDTTDAECGGNQAAAWVSLSGASVFGNSSPINFDDWKIHHNESQADGYAKISGHITIDYGATNFVPQQADLNLHFIGSLTPNIGFENDFFEAFGYATRTAGASASLSITENGIIRSVSSQVSYAELDFENLFSHTTGFSWILTNRKVEIDFEALMGGVGSRGGRFSFLHSGPSSFSSPSSFPDTSFFEIVLSLPPGVTATTDVPFLRVETIPEPEAGILILAGLSAAAWASRRRFPT